MTPSSTIPVDPIRTPAASTAKGRAKLPDPILAFAKLKKVATTLHKGDKAIKQREVQWAWSHFAPPWPGVLDRESSCMWAPFCIKGRFSSSSPLLLLIPNNDFIEFASLQ